MLDNKLKKAFYKGILASLKASIILSVIYWIPDIISQMLEIDRSGFINIYAAVLLFFILSLFITFFCILFILIPIVYLLRKIDFDKKRIVVPISIIGGTLVWLLLDLSLKHIYLPIIYAAICSYVFMWAYEKHK